jgi:lambda family phage portal protein
MPRKTETKAALQERVTKAEAALRTLVRARYDAAQTTPLNQRHWSMADYYSADASLSPNVRRMLRARARYELANNSYAAGMASTWANDLVGTGPRLQLDLGTDVDPAAVRRVELAVFDWMVNIDLARKLRIGKIAKFSDGEAFCVLTSNRRLAGVQLDVKLVEADQIVDPQGAPNPGEVDGLRFDADGNVTDYWITRHHPGSLRPGWTLDGRWESADSVLHWFHATRPGQHRGVGEIVPALELFAMLRRYTLAVVTAAETAADFAAILKTTMPADGAGAAGIDAWETMPIVRGMMMSAPEGWEPYQLKPEQPTGTYDSFVRRILNEIARSVNMPYIVAAMDSSSANYSSMRGDYLVYRKHQATERGDLERVVLDPLLNKWLDEAALVPNLIPNGLPPVAEWNWSWTWDGHEHVDPTKESEAEAMQLASNTATLAEICSKRGKNWQQVLRQRAVERQMETDLGLVAEPVSAAADEDEIINAGEDVQAAEGYRPPQAARAAARRGLELRREYGRGGTAVGIARARDIANGRELSLDTIGRMVSFFARHAAYKKNHTVDPPSNSYISWLLWGGDASRAWAERIWKREEANA